MHALVSPSAEVNQAAVKNGPIVALESTIITHGMPYPQNLETARAVENIVRENGAIPATIAVIDGTLKVGLSEAELDALAQSNNAMKLSRADLAYAMAMGKTGSTTVAATMIAAHRASIALFATGGIGGVHRGANDSFDISADLRELAQTPVTVVCAGAKAILDIPKTLEYLETMGVPVIAYRQTNLPAFWSRDSGLAAPLRIDNEKNVVRLMKMRTRLEIKGGVLIGNPVPEADEIAKNTMDGIIASAIEEADSAGVKGKAVTPWLLSRIFDLTNGDSLQTNQSLIRNNAALAARIAVEFAGS